ncbi:uncharacterized protein [Hemitrygon akajei]|uniref:uncharacterized protein n=1 Tax=Hemitrygon akajei TaxID=2704970 RepID=UPI003BF96442
MAFPQSQNPAPDIPKVQPSSACWGQPFDSLHPDDKLHAWFTDGSSRWKGGDHYGQRQHFIPSRRIRIHHGFIVTSASNRVSVGGTLSARPGLCLEPGPSEPGDRELSLGFRLHHRRVVNPFEGRAEETGGDSVRCFSYTEAPGLSPPRIGACCLELSPRPVPSCWETGAAPQRLPMDLRSSHRSPVQSERLKTKGEQGAKQPTLGHTHSQSENTTGRILPPLAEECRPKFGTGNEWTQ